MGLIRNFSLCVLAFFSFEGIGQTFKDYGLIRNFNKSLSVSLNYQYNETSTWSYSEYGQINSEFSSDNTNNAYLFQGQEFDKELGLILFPARLYELASNRFLQPDAASQYFSPYSFVGADPVNFVDHDGNMGKPLVLYDLETRSGNSRIASIASEHLSRDIDAHYMSLPDFLNGKFKSMMPEWNGNVFIDSHAIPEGHIIAESYTNKESIRTRPEAIKFQGVSESGEEMVVADNRVLGRNLARLSKETGVSVKNIVVGGCEGEEASRNIGGYFAGASKKMGLPKDFNIYGVRKGFKANYCLSEIRGAKHAKYRIGYHISNKKARPENFKYEKNKAGFESKVTDEYGEVQPVLDTDGIESMMNGRIPENISEHFSSGHFY